MPDIYKNRFRTLKDIFSNKYELEYFPAPGNDKKHFALILPGGGYTCVMSSIEGTPYAKVLNDKGYHAFVMRYNTREKGRYPIPQSQVAKAISEIINNADKYNVITDGYSIWGSSAGGHLAASFGTTNMGYSNYNLPKPGALILVYPVVTMGSLTHVGSRDNLLGPSSDKSLIDMASIENQITPDYPPSFLWNSLEDETVNPRNSQMLDEALTKAGVKHLYVQYKTGKHGCGLGIGLEPEGWIDKAIAFWEEQF